MSCAQENELWSVIGCIEQVWQNMVIFVLTQNDGSSAKAFSGIRNEDDLYNSGNVNILHVQTKQ